MAASFGKSRGHDFNMYFANKWMNCNFNILKTSNTFNSITVKFNEHSYCSSV